jgi:hypothetical protein
MIHRTLIAAVAAVAVVASTALAGGGGPTIPVRIKNVGKQSVSVNAASGTVSTSSMLAKSRALASNGITQFMVRKGVFTASAANPSALQTVNKVRQFDTRTFKTIYLYAQQDGTAATIVGAPGGVKF